MRTIQAAAFAVLSAAATPVRADVSPSPVPADPVARAAAAFADIQAGKFDRSQLTPALAGELSAADLASLRARTSPYGTPQSLTLEGKSDDGGVTTYTIRIAWPSATLDYVFGVADASGKIAKLYVVPGPPP